MTSAERAMQLARRSSVGEHAAAAASAVGAGEHAAASASAGGAGEQSAASASAGGAGEHAAGAACAVRASEHAAVSASAGGAREHAAASAGAVGAREHAAIAASAIGPGKKASSSKAAGEGCSAEMTLQHRAPRGELVGGCLESAEGKLGCAGRCGCRWYQHCFAKSLDGCEVGVCGASAGALVMVSLAIFLGMLTITTLCRMCWEGPDETAIPQRAVGSPRAQAIRMLSAAKAGSLRSSISTDASSGAALAGTAADTAAGDGRGDNDDDAAFEQSF